MHSFANLTSLFQRLLILLFIYFLLRLLFIFFNSEYLIPGGPFNILSVLFFGTRFDIAAIVMINTPFILLHYLPPPLFFIRGWQYLLKSVFYLINIPFVLINCIDLEYFPFSMRRTNSDLFNVLTLGKDTFNILPALIADFWHVVLIIAALIIIMEFLWLKADAVIIRHYRRVSVGSSLKSRNTIFFSRNYPDRSVRIILTVTLYIALTTLLVIGGRGGIQLRPINMIQAAQTGNQQHASFILNSTFSVIKSFGRMELEKKHFFTEVQCKELLPFGKNNPVIPTDSSGMRYNILVIILESFSPEFFYDSGTAPIVVPFLDSIRRAGLSFPHAYSSGRRTIDGIPAIVAGLPALMYTSYITSAYSGNRINSLASVLGQWGYESGFFHGGTNGTMGFDGFAKMAGFKHYYGRSEYNNDEHYDGTWGIFDDKFLGWSAGKLNNMKKPFFCALLTLSSHHPYSLPPDFETEFAHITDPVKKTIAYTDYSVRLFFKKISGYSWFDSTLFIFSADHSGPSELPVYQTPTGIYSIPLFFYMNGSRLKGTSGITAQQTDIFATVMDMLNCPLPYSSFGSSLLDTHTVHFAVNYSDNHYQIISGDYALFFSDTRVASLFNIRNDSLLRNNLAGSLLETENRLTDLLKADIQSFNNRMINNKLAPDPGNPFIP